MQMTFNGIGFPITNKKVKKKKNQRFKSYTTVQQEFYIGNLDSMVEKKHIARLISTVIDGTDITNIRNKYLGGGASAYDPAMLLKVWLLGYCYNTYTVRPLEKQLYENIAFMWISGNQKPDFKTLNNFRQKLEEDIKDIFKRAVECAIVMGLIDGARGFIDGTVVQANANRHKIVWKKSVKKALVKTRKEIDELTEEIFEHSKKLQKEEDKKYGDKGFVDDLEKEITVEDALEISKEVEKELKGKRDKTEEEKKAYKDAKRIQELKEREATWEEKEKKLGDKNSYSKTDTEAPAMMDKQGVIRPLYSEVVVTQNQIALDYETGNVGERRLLKPAVKGCEENTGKKLEEIISDGNFGDESNYDYLDKEEIEAYVKHNRFYKEKNKKWNEEKIRNNHFIKKEGEDKLVCPNGKELDFDEIKQVELKDGYTREIKKYKAKEEDCRNCLFKNKCTEAKARSVEISEKYEELKQKANERLESEYGKTLSKQRGYQVETIFGERKRNRRNRRFYLRGLKKVNIESGLFYSAYNMRKVYNYIIKNWHIIVNMMKNKAEMRLLPI